METLGLPLFDKQCNELTGVSLKYAKDWPWREYPKAAMLGEYFLRIGKLKEPGGTSAGLPKKEVLSQLTFRLSV